jgi:hypothetical protein
VARSLEGGVFRPADYSSRIEPRTDFEVINEYLTRIKHDVLSRVQVSNLEVCILRGLIRTVTKQWKSLNHNGYEVISDDGYTMLFVDREEMSKPCNSVRVQMLRRCWEYWYGVLSYFFDHLPRGRYMLSSNSLRHSRYRVSILSLCRICEQSRHNLEEIIVAEVQ